MISSQVIMQTIQEIPENKLIFASRLYDDLLWDKVTESAFYQTLGRMCKSGSLCRIAKGTYYRPKTGKYGTVPPSQKEIIAAFTEPDAGMVIGYELYNNLKLTTQIPKTVEVYSSKITQQTKNISNVSLQYCDLIYTAEVKNMVNMLEVLKNFNKIQDMNYVRFIAFCEEFIRMYDNKVFEQIMQQIRYPKKTISFLKTILEHYGVPHQLGHYLSTLSEYKHPTMEEIYETARLA